MTPHAAAAGAPSIVLISMDTLRADHLGAYGDARGLTPNLDAFARESVTFDSAWAQANYTLMSHASLFTGRYPSEIARVVASAIIPAQPPTLAEVLGYYGYSTGGFVGGGMLDPCRGLNRGFVEFSSPGCTHVTTLWQSAPPAWEWLRQQDATKPTFTFLHGYDAHEPYLKPTPFGMEFATAPPASIPAGDSESGAISPEQLDQVHLVFGNHMLLNLAATRAVRNGVRMWDLAAQRATEGVLKRPDTPSLPLSAADLQAIREHYAGGAAYGDAWFGWFIEELRRSGRLEHSIVVVLSDHGESLGEDGRFGHSQSLRDEVSRVPLIIRMPGSDADKLRGTHVAQMVELVDVMPTLLAAASAPPPAGCHGRSLLPLLRGEADEGRSSAYTEGNENAISVRTPRGRLTFAGVEASSPYLPMLLEKAPLNGPSFDASSVDDPTLRAALRDQLVATRKTLSPTPGTNERVDPEVVEAMKKRGYWDREE